MLKIITLFILFTSTSVFANETFYKISYTDLDSNSKSSEISSSLSEIRERLEILKYNPETFSNIEIEKIVKINNFETRVFKIKRGGEGGGE